MNALPLTVLAAHVVAWHNRPPLARRIGAAQVLNKKDGLISELPNPDQFEDFLDEDARSYDGKKLSKVERFPQYYILEVDTSDAGEKRKQPK